jgi:multidrug resistance efflux pump
MRPLRKRIRADNIPNERRVARGSAGRIVYLVSLALFVLAILNYFFGDFLLLRADGLVLRQHTVVATTFVARVEKVDVRQGEVVNKGDLLVRLQSIEILERIADLSLKRADLAAKATEFRIRADSVKELLPLADRRAVESKKVVEQFDGMAKEGFVRTVPYAEALSANYGANRDLVTLTSQSRVLEQELSTLEDARADADAAFRDVQLSYDNGEVRAPVSGAVGAVVPFAGDVARIGDPLLSIYWGEPYVLLFLPRRYLFNIDVGTELEVTDGQTTERGVVTEILQITESLPREFQNTFKPSDRNQLAKVKLPADSRFPLNQKVYVSEGYF